MGYCYLLAFDPGGLSQAYRKLCYFDVAIISEGELSLQKGLWLQFF